VTARAHKKNRGKGLSLEENRPFKGAIFSGCEISRRPYQGFQAARVHEPSTISLSFAQCPAITAARRLETAGEAKESKDEGLNVAT
jgi:hypothetical protein